MDPAITAGGIPNESDEATRRSRWRFFQWLFALTCLAVGLDLITTYLGFRRVGSRYEQNAIALFLIQHLGWIGISALLVLTCAVCLKSFKLVYWNLSLNWSRWLNVVMCAVCVFRLVVVVSDIWWLFSPG
jgi:hypothetical protein